MLLTVLIAGVIVGRLWATPVLALTWVIPVALTSGASLEVLVDAFTSGLIVAAVGVAIRLGFDRLARPVTARA